MPLPDSMACAARWIARGIKGVALAVILACPGMATPIVEAAETENCELVQQESLPRPFEGVGSPLDPDPDPDSNSDNATPTVEPATVEADLKLGYPHITHQGQIQFQLDDGSLGSPRASSPFPSSNGIGPFPADARLFVRRFRPAFNLAISPKLDLQTEFNIDPTNHRIQLLDARFNYDLGERIFLSAGRFKVPFGWEGLRSSRSTNTIERSDVTSALYPERDVGLSITHNEPHLGQFSLGTFLGQPRSNGGSNGHFDAVGRGLFHISDQLSVGVSGHAGTYRPSGRDHDLPVRRAGLEVQYKDGPLQLEGEAIYSDGYNSMSSVSTRAFGYYAAAVYQLAEPLDLVLQYDRFDPNLDAVDVRQPLNATNARDRKVIGLNYYIDRKLMHRVMLNYELKQDLEGPTLRTNGFRLRYQLAW